MAIKQVVVALVSIPPDLLKEAPNSLEFVFQLLFNHDFFRKLVHKF